jgi:hypothetical protein
LILENELAPLRLDVRFSFREILLEISSSARSI